MSSLYFLKVEVILSKYDDKEYLVNTLNYGGSIDAVIPWSALSGRNRRALHHALLEQGNNASNSSGFTFLSLQRLKFENILNVRNIGPGTIASLVSEIQVALDEISDFKGDEFHSYVVWNLAMGERIARKDLHDKYGGVREGGISPVDTKSKNIFIFSNPRVNAEHGYEPDIWLDDDTFLYCGEGPSGDQELVRYNKSILNHSENNKVLRVFEGTRGEVIYRGAFELDSEKPWFHKESVGFDGKKRKVIMFRLVRINTGHSNSIIEPEFDLKFRWNCRIHGAYGESESMEEIEFLASAHMNFRNHSIEECEIQIANPNSDFLEIDENELSTRNRNREIVELRTSGKSLEEIGSKFGVSRERVRQILQKSGGPTLEDVKSLRETIRIEQLERIRIQALEMIKAKPGQTLKFVADTLEITSSELGKILGERDLLLFAKSPRSVNHKWSDEEIIYVLKEAATLEFPLTVSAYSALLEEGYLRGPSAARIAQRFKSWQFACDLAGVEAGRRTRPLDISKWTNEDLYAAVVEYLNLPQSTGASSDYESWASGNEDVPSLGTLRNRLGTWNQVRNQAIERMNVNGEE